MWRTGRTESRLQALSLVRRGTWVGMGWGGHGMEWARDAVCTGRGWSREPPSQRSSTLSMLHRRRSGSQSKLRPEDGATPREEERRERRDAYREEVRSKGADTREGPGRVSGLIADHQRGSERGEGSRGTGPREGTRVYAQVGVDRGGLPRDGLSRRESSRRSAQDGMARDRVDRDGISRRESDRRSTRLSARDDYSRRETGRQRAPPRRERFKVWRERIDHLDCLERCPMTSTCTESNVRHLMHHRTRASALDEPQSRNASLRC